MKKIDVFPWVFAWLCLFGVAVCTLQNALADCDYYCKEDLCFKELSQDTVWRFAAKNAWQMWAVTSDGDIDYDPPNGVAFYNQCPNQPLNCSVITGSAHVGSCPEIKDCVHVGNAAKAECVAPGVT